ncbi:MAG: hypothetical protein ACE5Z5_02430 [Candidatus Bathyarchaeia archaeon]
MVDIATVRLIINIVTLFVGCALAFILHEYGHVFAARMHGMRAEAKLRAYRRFDAQDARRILRKKMYISVVEIGGKTTPEREGRIASAGIAINLLQAAIALPWGSYLPSLRAIFALNLGLALINLIPFSMSDGKRTYDWSKPVWGLLLLLDILFWLVFF